MQLSVITPDDDNDCALQLKFHVIVPPAVEQPVEVGRREQFSKLKFLRRRGHFREAFFRWNELILNYCEEVFCKVEKCYSLEFCCAESWGGLILRNLFLRIVNRKYHSVQDMKKVSQRSLPRKKFIESRILLRRGWLLLASENNKIPPQTSRSP